MAIWDRAVTEELARSSAVGRVPRVSRKGIGRRGPARGKDPIRSIHVYGFKELEDALDMVVPALQKKALRVGSRKAAQLVAVDVRKRAPVGDADDPHYHRVGEPKSPGTLKKNVKVRALPRSRSTMGHEVNIGGNQLFVGDQFYAGFQELGWIHTGSKGGRRGNGTPIEGQAFMRGALYDNEKQVHAVFIKETKNKLGQITREILADSGGGRIARGAKK